jgi:hypothetical protein
MKTIKSHFNGKICLVVVTTFKILSFSSFDIKLSTEANSKSLQQSLKPYGWFLSGSNPDEYKAGIDTLVSQHDRQSATVESIVENPSGFCTLMQTCIKKDFIGKRIKMTAYIKSLNTTSAAMWARVDDYDKKLTADFDNMMDRPISGTTDWTKYEIVFDASSKCSIFYGFILKGNGKIWVDNVSLEIVDSTTTKTAHDLNAPFPEEYRTQLGKLPEELPEKYPVNLDFEDNNNAL